MNDQADKVEDVYQRTLASFRAVIRGPADAEQKEAAQNAFDQAQIARAEADLATIAGRTVLLQSLSAALVALTQSVQTNPIGDAFDTLKGVTDEVGGLLKEVKGEGGGSG